MKRRSLIIIVIILILTIFAYIKIKNTLTYRYKEVVDKYSYAYNIESEYIYSVIKSESNFYPYAKSNKGAYGIMQLTKETKEWIETKLNINYENPYDIKNGIQAGTWYISWLNARYNNMDLAIIAYNAGHGAVDSWLKKGIISNKNFDVNAVPYPETKKYFIKVKTYYGEYKKRK